MSFNQQFLDVVLKIQDYLKVSEEDMAATFSVNSFDWKKLKRGEFEFNSQQLWDLCRSFHLSPDQVMNGSIDYGALKASIENRLVGVKKYEVGSQKLSSGNGIVNVINFLDSYYGRDFTNNVFYKFQVDPALFCSKSPTRVSSLLPNDIFKELSRFGLFPEHFRLMGLQNVDALKEVGGKQLLDQTSEKKAFECLIDDIIPTHYDNFFKYEALSSSKDRVLIKVSPSEESREMFQGDCPFGFELENYLQGAFSAVLKVFGRKGPRISPLSSVIDGSSFSLFELSWIKDSVRRQPGLFH